MPETILQQAAKLSPSTAPARPKPNNVWHAFLLSLVGKRVKVVTQGYSSQFTEYEGTLVAISLDHMNCALARADGTVLAFKNVHHIEHAPRGPR